MTDSNAMPPIEMVVKHSDWGSCWWVKFTDGQKIRVDFIETLYSNRRFRIRCLKKLKRAYAATPNKEWLKIVDEALVRGSKFLDELEASKDKAEAEAEVAAMERKKGVLTLVK